MVPTYSTVNIQQGKGDLVDGEHRLGGSRPALSAKQVASREAQRRECSRISGITKDRDMYNDASPPRVFPFVPFLGISLIGRVRGSR